MRVEVRHTEREYLEGLYAASVRAQQLFPELRRPDRGIRRILAKIGAGLLFLTALALMTGANEFVGGVATLIAAASLAVLAFGPVSWLIRRVPRAADDFIPPRTYEITESGLRHESMHSSGIWPWREIQAIDRHCGFLLIFFDDMVLVIPESQFPSAHAVTVFASELQRRVFGEAAPLAPWGPRRRAA